MPRIDFDDDPPEEKESGPPSVFAWDRLNTKPRTYPLIVDVPKVFVDRAKDVVPPAKENGLFKLPAAFIRKNLHRIKNYTVGGQTTRDKQNTGSGVTPVPTLVNLALTTPNEVPVDPSIGYVICQLLNTTPGSLVELFNDNSDRFDLDGLNVIVGGNPTFPTAGGGYGFIVRETLEDATNSPHDTFLFVWAGEPTNVFETPVLTWEGIGDYSTVTDGQWTGNPTSFLYTWQREESPGDWSQSFDTSVPTALFDEGYIPMLGQMLRVKVTATNALGSGIAYSNEVLME